MAYQSGNAYSSQAQLAAIWYLGRDQQSEFEAARKNFTCQCDCDNAANACLQSTNTPCRANALEAAKDCMSDYAECKMFCRGV